MRVFVTGASGWIGSAVVPELIGAGHEVVGLARSDAKAAALEAAGAEVLRGDLDDLDGLRAAAAASDGVIHLAFKHDLAFSGDFAGATTADQQAIAAIGDALAGSGKPFLIASGIAGIAPGKVLTEEDGLADDGGNARLANAHLTTSYAAKGVRTAVVRLPPTVHGEGDYGFVSVIAGAARDKGVSPYVGDGTQRWCAVHVSDAARLFRLALESAPAGSTLHAIAEEGVPLRAVAEAIGRGIDVPVTSVTAEEAPAHFSFLAGFVGLDIPASSTATRELLGWEPTGPTLLDDLEKGHYFRG
jgi:nucleoside-diphosphate-sugar epimerase